MKQKTPEEKAIGLIEKICGVLQIKTPKISHDTKCFSTESTIMNVDSGGVLYMPEIKREDQIDFDFIFSVAHELRHIWQIRTNEKYWFSDYKSSAELTIDEYNQQPAEVDAHAFGAFVMMYCFGIIPQFYTFNSTTKTMIFAREEEIEEMLENDE